MSTIVDDEANRRAETHPILEGRPLMIGDRLAAMSPDDDGHGQTPVVHFAVGALTFDWQSAWWPSGGPPVGWTVQPADTDLGYEWPITEVWRDHPAVAHLIALLAHDLPLLDLTGRGQRGCAWCDAPAEWEPEPPSGPQRILTGIHVVAHTAECPWRAAHDYLRTEVPPR